MASNGRQPLDKRLAHVLRAGNLTVADLARLLDRPYPTVRGWVKDGREIGGGALDAAWVIGTIVRLERRIRERDGLPVPRLSSAERIRYIKELIR